MGTGARCLLEVYSICVQQPLSSDDPTWAYGFAYLNFCITIKWRPKSVLWGPGAEQFPRKVLKCWYLGGPGLFPGDLLAEDRLPMGV